jgi:enterochelin esterase-like enzyme
MDDAKYYKRTVEKLDIASTYLGNTRHVRIFLPPGYDESISYPVIYCQDGEEFFNFGRIATHATRLILDEAMQPMIIVGVDVDMERRTEEYSPEGSRFGSYCKFFVEELLPYTEERFPIRKDPVERVLAGDSLGGTVSLHLALDYPLLFNHVMALSGAFFPSTQERLALENDLSWLRVYMIIGLDEGAVKLDRGTVDFLQLNRETKALLEQKKVSVEYKEKPGDHTWGFWQNEVPDALKWFY